MSAESEPDSDEEVEQSLIVDGGFESELNKEHEAEHEWEEIDERKVDQHGQENFYESLEESFDEGDRSDGENDIEPYNSEDEVDQGEEDEAEHEGDKAVYVKDKDEEHKRETAFVARADDTTTPAHKVCRGVYALHIVVLTYMY